MKSPFKRKVATLIGLWALIGIAYSSSFMASWHLDDFPNIVRNEKIHLTRFDFNSVVDTFFAGPSGKPYRPVTMASFALNWYFNGSEILGYRSVNILIHCFNGFLLYLVVLHLLQTPRLSGTYRSSQIHWIALLASVFWALNPMQTQAVTYIVQRMASMAALFFLLGIYSYLRYRNAASGGTGKWFMAGCIACYLLAILSKENAILFPISIYLVETIFYPSGQRRKIANGKWWLPVALILLTLIIGLAFFFMARGNPFHLIEGLYADRPFTASQRLLTEFRILLMYLSQLFFPISSRLSFCHDITVSTSFIEPWTTLPAVLIVGAAVVLSITGYRKKPLISFACLFSFLNHGVESTIIPLELAFEHRNYLPSFFLFLPLASWIVTRMNRYLRTSAKYGHYLVVAIVLVTVGLLCNWTFARNLVWQSSKTLWEDEITKNPELARPYHNLAWGYYQARGQYERALELYRKALNLKAHTPYEVASTLNNMGRIYYLMGDYDRALHFLGKSISKHPQQKIAEYQIVMALMQLDRWQEAIQRIDSALQVNEFDSFYLKLKGIALSRMGDDDRSVVFLYRSLKQNPDAVDTRNHLCIALSRLGRFDEALNLFTGNGKVKTENPQSFLVLAEIEKMKGNLHVSEDTFQHFIRYQGIEKSKKMLLAWVDDKLSVGVDYRYFLTKVDQMGNN